MLKLMAPENNSNNSSTQPTQGADPISPDSASGVLNPATPTTPQTNTPVEPVTQPVVPQGNTPSPASVAMPNNTAVIQPPTNIDSANSPNSSATVTPSTPATSATNQAAPKPKKSWLKALVLLVIVVGLIGAASYISYSMGKKHSKIVYQSPPSQPINLPPQAIVTSECTNGRGKQYIIPKDIPQGPIYDVYNNKVIAIEYVLGINSLLSNSDSFSNTIISLVKNYPVDHFAVAPGTPKPGDTDEFIHLIMFVVPKSVTDSITCGATSSSSSSSSSSTATH